MIRSLNKINLVNVLAKYFLNIVFDITFPPSDLSGESVYAILCALGHSIFHDNFMFHELTL